MAPTQFNIRTTKRTAYICTVSDIHTYEKGNMAGDNMASSATQQNEQKTQNGGRSQMRILPARRGPFAGGDQNRDGGRTGDGVAPAADNGFDLGVKAGGQGVAEGVGRRGRCRNAGRPVDDDKAGRMGS